MKKILTSLALAAAIFGPIPALANDPARAATMPVANADLDRLVLILAPDDTMLDLALRAFDYTVEQDSKNAGILAAYARDPRLKTYVAAALRPEFALVLRRELPALRADIAGIISSEMTPAEIADTTIFFASPTGAKLYANALRSLGEKPGEDEQAAKTRAMEAVMAGMTAEDYPAMIAFGASGASKKMGSINPKISAASKAWADRLIAQNGASMRNIAAKAAQTYKTEKH